MMPPRSVLADSLGISVEGGVDIARESAEVILARRISPP